MTAWNMSPRVMSLQTRPSEGGGEACRCGQVHGTTAEVINSVDVAVRDGCRASCITRMRLLDACVATATSNATGRACKRLQGIFCSVVT